MLRKINLILIFLFLFYLFKLLIPSITLALPEYCPLKINGQPAEIPIVEFSGSRVNQFKFDFDISSIISSFPSNAEFSVDFPGYTSSTCIPFLGANTCAVTINGTTASITLDSGHMPNLAIIGDYNIGLHQSGTDIPACSPVKFQIIPKQIKQCYITLSSSTGFCNVNSNITIRINDGEEIGRITLDGPQKLEHGPVGTSDFQYIGSLKYFDWNVGQIVAGSYNVVVEDWSLQYRLCNGSFQIYKSGENIRCRQIPKPTSIPTITIGPTYRPGEPTYTPVPPIPALKPLCEQTTAAGSTMRTDCETCINNGNIWSAIGCLPSEPSTFVQDYILTTGVGLAGGIAFLYFLYGSFLVLTSAGSAERIQEGRQIIVSAISGLILIIFSIFLLRVIGVDILKLPEFSR